MSLKVSASPLHGRGCFAARDLAKGETVARAELLALPPEEMELLFRTLLKNYVFYLKDGPTPDGPYHTALAMGPVSFCNHSSEANCDFAIDEAASQITLVARRNIREDEEITIDYGDYAEKII